jgi:hypothetical protein
MKLSPLYDEIRDLAFEKVTSPAGFNGHPRDELLA